MRRAGGSTTHTRCRSGFGDPLWLPASLIRGAFRSGRDFSAWIGLVPKQNFRAVVRIGSGNISKRGDRYLRSLLTTGALAVIRYAKNP